MITVRLIDDHRFHPERMANHAGRICYNPTIDNIEDEKMINVRAQLFDSSHHTTWEHQLLNFEIDGISVSDITLGKHLIHPFYNTDQRSGRFSKMYENADFDEIEKYLIEVYSESAMTKEILEFVKYGYSLFHTNIDKATEIAKELLRERVKNDETYINENAKKMAQEQLRNVISTIFTTGDLFSIDIPTISAIYEEPTTPGMKIVGDKMKEEVLKLYPELHYIFRDEERNLEYDPLAIFSSFARIANYPECILLDVYGDLNKIVVPNISDMIPIDKLSYKKKYMNNSFIEIHSGIKVSVATMGQDQRHRSIKRGMPAFTGEFYSPEVVTELRIKKEITQLMDMWFNLRGMVHGSLFDALAPYGAMVYYEKIANVNALAHEQLKRTCFCAQEEIYNLNRILRDHIEDDFGKTNLPKIFLPPCMYENGRCYEGKRNCRRIEKDPLNPCPPRKI